jgi:hypothetical protein
LCIQLLYLKLALSLQQLTLRFKKEFPSDKLSLSMSPLHHLQLKNIDLAVPLSVLKNVKILELNGCFILNENCTVNALVVSFRLMEGTISFQKILFSKIMKIYLTSVCFIHLNALGNYATFKLLYLDETRMSMHRSSAAQPQSVDCRHFYKLYLEYSSLNRVTNFSGLNELY